MSKHAVALLAAWVLLVAAACTPKPAPADPAEDEKLRSESLIWFEHFAKTDGQAMGNLYAEDALLMPPGKPAV